MSGCPGFPLTKALTKKSGYVPDRQEMQNTMDLVCMKTSSEFLSSVVSSTAPLLIASRSFRCRLACLFIVGGIWTALSASSASAGSAFAMVGEVRTGEGYARSPSRTIAIDTTVGEAGRILAQPGEKFSISLNLIHAKTDQPLRISAGMGGVIDGKSGPLVRSKLGEPNVQITFSVGKTRGRYLLEIGNGREFSMLEFWVGEEPPQGKAGPPRVFQAPANLR